MADELPAELPPELPDQQPDELPAELDVTRHTGEYRFPDVGRRRTIGALYLVAAGLLALGWWRTGNRGVVVAAVLVAGAAAWHVAAAWDRRVDEQEALAVAARTVGFAVGHASAQLVFRGLRSRPAWRILLYSAEDPPTKRGLVELDAVDGHVLGQFTQDNPEDWSQFPRS